MQGHVCLAVVISELPTHLAALCWPLLVRGPQHQLLLSLVCSCWDLGMGEQPHPQNAEQQVGLHQGYSQKFLGHSVPLEVLGSKCWAEPPAIVGCTGGCTAGPAGSDPAVRNAPGADCSEPCCAVLEIPCIIVCPVVALPEI